MSKKNAKIFTEDQIKEAIKIGRTMGGAAKYLKIDARTFKKKAEAFNLYEPSGQSTKKFDLKDIIFNGKHPQYPTSKLLGRLIKEGYKEYVCEVCDISEYNGKHISLEVDHIDGNNSNHHLDNLRILCPNCHSQTDTYRSKKLKKR